MIDNYLWEELVTFAEQKTLAKTAATLHVTQPSITRGMKKLEDELGVILFDRQPNRITLTPTGELAVAEARKILELNQHAVTKIENFYQSKQLISIACTIPGPRILLHALKNQLPLNTKVENQLQLGDLSHLLTQREYTVVLSNQEIFTPEIESRFLGTEQLSINLNQFMYQANQPALTFSDLNGLSFLVLADIGIWKEIIQANILDAKFLYQQQEETFSEISKYSDFPYFSTNISKLNPQFDDRNATGNSRVTLPIHDASARMEIYANYLKKQKKTITPILETIAQNWPQP